MTPRNTPIERARDYGALAEADSGPLDRIIDYSDSTLIYTLRG